MHIYISGYENKNSIIILKCLIHDLEFQTKYENVRHKEHAHYVCPICQKENAEKRNALNRVEKQCAYCGKTFTCSKSKAETRQFCCRKCKDTAQRIESGPDFTWLRPAHYSINAGKSIYRKNALNYYAHECAVCGWDEDVDILEVHHIDNDRNNNELSNLIILCPTCHKKLTSHKYRLIGRTDIVLIT